MANVFKTKPLPHGSLQLDGDLVIPSQAQGLVVFAHCSGSGRQSPRDQWVARALQRSQMATLQIDLLTEDESRDGRRLFDIDLLAHRMIETIRWTSLHPDLTDLRLGLFGASASAGAALVAAAARPDRVAAVVSRGGRPNLVMDHLEQVQAPTLLIVGGLDDEVLALNREAMRRLHVPRRLEVIPGAGHRFEEPGALGSVAIFASSWFSQYLCAARPT
ncbi:dienelactone hydrolase family protein [Hydrogenophaga sp. BPS33]|uniref:dienelactone hydrolase family protein n=1 Tax=Hydrogenophaga sp. BPS33 TaxID=2651974 RepID=UPI00131F633A|nr:alpha/beta family hydrolase [Hydrogenophaga sp. BPS33]QHE86230.1 alpha/beta hydrolase [Hydrogenophaga sp. BPS33]